MAGGIEEQMQPGNVEIGDLRRDEFRAAADVVAVAMCDNATDVAIHGEDRERRVRHLRAMSRFVLSSRTYPAIVARYNGAPVGVVSVASPGTCMPSVAQQIRTIPLFFRLGPKTVARLAAYSADWAGHEPREPHWHIGPVAVHPDFQGQGIGSRMMEDFNRRLAQQGQTAYLETDNLENVGFYQRSGYELYDEGDLAGIHYWFLRRRFNPTGR